MADDPTRGGLERTWAEVRACFAEYRLNDLRAMLGIPEGAPVPDRAQARQFADALPDLGRARFLKIVATGDRAAYYAKTAEREVTVIRFRRTDRGWTPLPAPHTMSSFSTDEEIDPEALIGREPSLRADPGDESPAPEPAGAAEPVDARPEPEIRKELEAAWKRIRDAFASGRPERAAADLLFTEGRVPPTAEEAKAAAKDRLPDLVRSQFLKLGWKAGKPGIVGYYAETKVGDFKKSTLALIVFVRDEGRWKFAPGPAALEVVEIPRASRAALLQLIEKDPRLAL